PWMDEPMVLRSKPDSDLARHAEMVWLPERAALWSAVLLQRGVPAQNRATLQKWSRITENPGSLYAAARKEGRIGLAWVSYFAVFSLSLKLKAAGFKVRLILTDPVDYRPNFWKHEIKKYHGLGDFFDLVEVQPNYDRSPVEVSPNDQFLATSWWTAFAAHSGA